MEPNLVENWLRRDPIRWVSGSLAGIFGAIVATIFAMFLSVSSGLQSWFPLKLLGTILMGASATDVDLTQGAVYGGVLFAVVSAFLGMVFAHFVYTNVLQERLIMGVVWGVFSWIFLWNLFMQSFKPIYAAQIPSTAVFPV